MAASSMVSSMCDATSLATNRSSPAAGPSWPAYSMTATTQAIVPSWVRSPTSPPLPRRASASSRIAAIGCSTSWTSAGPRPLPRTSARSRATSGSLNGGSERTLASRISRSVTCPRVIASPRRTLQVAALTPKAGGKLLARAGGLPARGSVRGELDRAGKRAAAHRVPRRHHHRAPADHLTNGDLESQIQTILEGEHHVLRRSQLGADEHTAKVTANQPRLDLISGAHLTHRAADMAEPPDCRQPVCMLDIGDDREGILGRYGQGDFGFGFDHGRWRLVHHCREHVRRFEAQPLIDTLRDHVVLIDVEAVARHIPEDG